MAIQKINLGTEPLGEGGDTYRSANTKINENFSNSTHAASKLVGSASGQVPLNSHLGTASKVNVGRADGQIPLAEDINQVVFGRDARTLSEGDVVDAPFGYYYAGSGTTGKPGNISSGVLHSFAGYYSSSGPTDSQYFYSYFDDNIYFRGRRFRDGAYRDWRLIYHSGNTTKDSATGFLKVSSPVLHVYNDSITKIHEAEQLDITVEKKGVGHYEIHGSSENCTIIPISAIRCFAGIIIVCNSNVIYVLDCLVGLLGYRLQFRSFYNLFTIL